MSRLRQILASEGLLKTAGLKVNGPLRPALKDLVGMMEAASVRGEVEQNPGGLWLTAPNGMQYQITRRSGKVRVYAKESLVELAPPMEPGKAMAWLERVTR